MKSATLVRRSVNRLRPSGFSRRRPWAALLLWVVALGLITAAAAAAGDSYRNDFSLPGTDSQELLDTVKEHAPLTAGDTVTVVLHDQRGWDEETAAVAELVRGLEALPHVAAVVPPAGAGSVSADGTTGLATIVLASLATEVPVSEIHSISALAEDASVGSLRVELSGDAVRDVLKSEAGGGGGEGVGVVIALLVLVLMFGSALAASLPIITAAFAVGATFGLVVLASHVAIVPDYTAPILLLVGLGVGIDYALLIFSRFRSELNRGIPRGAATEVATRTAGRAVLFAGCTVIIALLGLYVLGLGALQGIALGVAATVMMTMVASMTLLPALLVVFGTRLEKAVHRRAAKARPQHRWYSWAQIVQHRAVPTVALSLAALGVLAIPAFSMSLGFADAGNDQPSTTTRAAYDLIGDEFGSGANGPLVVVAEGDGRAARIVRGKVADHRGIVSVSEPQPSPDGVIHTMVAIPTSNPQDERTRELVHDLRDSLGPNVLVGGATAAGIDFSVAVANRLPAFIGVVILLSALLLTVVFRSVVIAIKASLLNLVSIAAALGVVTFVFGQGHFGADAGPVEAFIPVLIFAIVFGLSMDYEVFLVSRIHEEWLRTGDAAAAIRNGVAATGSVIAAAASIMIAVFGGFLLSPDRMLQQLGLGLATAIAVDALVIRCAVVPALMHLLGRHAWWAPRWLTRLLPRFSLEGD